MVRVAGVSHRADAVQDNAFSPRRRPALVCELDNRYDENAVGIWDEGRKQAGYVPATDSAAVVRLLESRAPVTAVSLWEFRKPDRARCALRALVAPTPTAFPFE